MKITKNERMQIMFAPNVKKYEKMAINWYNIVMDITDYLKSKGFEYSRTLGFVNDRVLSDEEVMEIAQQINEIAYGMKNLLYCDVQVIGETIHYTGEDLQRIFGEKQKGELYE